MNFKGKWRLRNGWEAVIDQQENGRWCGKIYIGATKVVSNWDENGDSDTKDLDLMERLEWRARI